MRRHLVALLILSAGCSSMEQPRFEIRGLTGKTDRTEYGERYSYEASILQTFPSAPTNDYVITMEIVRQSDGDPTSWPTDTVRHHGYLVRRGVGTFYFDGGYKSLTSGVFNPANNWKPAKVSVRVIGYTPVQRYPN